MPLTPNDVLSNLAYTRLYATPQEVPGVAPSPGGVYPTGVGVDLVRAIADAILTAVSQGYQQGIQQGILQGLVQQAGTQTPVPSPVETLQAALMPTPAPAPAPAPAGGGGRVSVRNLFSWNPKVGSVSPVSPVRQPSETYLTKQAVENILARIAGRRVV